MEADLRDPHRLGVEPEVPKRLPDALVFVDGQLRVALYRCMPMTSTAAPAPAARYARSHGLWGLHVGRGGDDARRRVDAVDGGSSRNGHPGENGRGPAVVVSLDRFVPHLVAEDAALVALHDRGDVPGPVGHVAGLRGGAGAVGALRRGAGRGPGGGLAQHQDDIGPLRPRLVDLRVEGREVPRRRRRLQLGPRRTVPQPERADGRIGLGGRVGGIGEAVHVHPEEAVAENRPRATCGATGQQSEHRQHDRQSCQRPTGRRRPVGAVVPISLIARLPAGSPRL